jgi:hypothetical protein
MGTLAPELPARSGESFASDLAGMGSFFIDPQGAARRVHTRWFWIGPLVIFSIVSIIATGIMMPLVRQVMETGPLPQGATPEQYQKGIALTMLMMRLTMYCAPIIAAVLFAIQAAVLLGASALMSVKATFRELFNLVAGCALIQVISSIAGLVVVKAKGDISTPAELRPALGLDIFLPAGSNKFLAAFLGYFSVFEIWWIVMIVLIFAAAFKVRKGKAFAAVLPLIVLNLLFRLMGAAFQH